MKFNVYLDSDDKRVKEYVDKTIEKINSHQSEFILVDKRDSVNNQKIRECIEKSVNSKNEISFELAKSELNLIDKNEKRIIITDRLFYDNWFAHFTEDIRLITVGDWEDLYAPPRMDKHLQFRIIYFFAICGVNLTVNQSRGLAHHGTADCIFDFCAYKTDVKISMRTGRICPECKQKLFDFGLTDKQFKALDILLKIMSGKATFENVFIVHGHGEYKNTVARFIESMCIMPIILSEQPNDGRTIIDKFEDEASKTDFAIIIYAPDDVGGGDNASLRPRARQNVVFEHGFFTAKLGRKNVAVLLKKDVEKPIETAGDNDGVIYIPFDDNNGWKEEIRKALKLAGYNVERETALAGKR